MSDRATASRILCEGFRLISVSDRVMEEQLVG
jgi:hypothetical protein